MQPRTRSADARHVILRVMITAMHLDKAACMYSTESRSALQSAYHVLLHDMASLISMMRLDMSVITGYDDCALLTTMISIRFLRSVILYYTIVPSLPHTFAYLSSRGCSQE